MGITQVDIMQTEQIEALQDDVVEVKDKLNLVVADITALVTKLNQAISDADDLNDVINAGYSVASGGGAADTGILKRMNELFIAFEAHRHQPTSNTEPATTGTWILTHPPSQEDQTQYGTPSTAGCNLSGTAQGNNNARSTYSATAQIATVTGVYTPEQQGVMTLKTKAEIRARKTARTLVKKTR